MSEKTKKLKSALVRMREVIAKKFRQLHDQKDECKRRSTEKYEPITSTLQKLIDSKKNKNKSESTSEEIPSNSSQRHQNTPENSNQTDSYENDINEPEFDDELSFDDYQHYDNETNNQNNENLNDHTQNQAVETESIHQLLLENENSPVDMDINDTTQSSTMDYADTDDIEVPKRTIVRKRIRKEIDDDENNALGNERKRDKKLNTNKKRQLTATTKKKWNELQYLKAVRRMAMAKIKPNVARASRAKPKVSVSPEDYDEDGYYRGAEKPKRRKIVTSSLRYMMVQPRTGRKVNRKKPVKRVAAKQTVAGEGLEREFIPYTENIVYQYWVNPNELCDRLRLLLSSKAAGNTNHEQEINSIIEELRERNVVM